MGGWEQWNERVPFVDVDRDIWVTHADYSMYAHGLVYEFVCTSMCPSKTKHPYPLSAFVIFILFVFIYLFSG